MERHSGIVVPKMRRRVLENDIKGKEMIRQQSNLFLTRKCSDILEEALYKRQIAVNEIIAERRAAEEEEYAMLQELKKDEEIFSNLVLENNKKRVEVENLEKKLEVAKQMKHLTKEQTKVKKLEEDIEKLKLDIKAIMVENDLYEEFQKEIGVYHGGLVEEGLILVAFTKIHPTYPDDMYYLFFTKLQSDFSFEVHHAEPNFREFNDLVEEFKGSKDIKEFYHRVCEYWKRDARASGTPRHATPGARVSIGKCN